MNEGMENLKQIEELEGVQVITNKILDKLEQRIASLEKVLASHAKCIGEMREDKEDKELREDYLAGKFDE